MEFKLVSLDDISLGKGNYGIGASAVPYSNEKYTYLRITHINEDGYIK